MQCSNCGFSNSSGSNFCKECGQKLIAKWHGWFSRHRNKFFAIIGFFLFIALFGSQDTSTSSLPETTPTVTIAPTKAVPTVKPFDQKLVTSSVVNIFCSSTEGEDESTGGSGTIIDDEGLILTNSHIIPQDDKDVQVDKTGCLVVLPDPVTGLAKDIYLANPIVIPNISDKYDLAYMSIYAAYYDEEEKEYIGKYPRKFPVFDDTDRCSNESVKLGESVRIFGYPAISGGYSLTVTDGIVSSFSRDGLIYTSAKISHGNSGGIAIDSKGCMIGVPSFVSTDENSSLGIIIPTNLISEFSDEVIKALDEK